jgi:quercetin dioxygenase-like cupin family protein
MSVFRNVLLGALTILMLSALLALGPARIGWAQATPTAEAIVRETLGTGQSAVAPERTLLLERRTFAPGSDSGAHPAPGPVVLSVESGTVEFLVPEGAALVTRAGDSAEPLAAGSKVTLNTGDAVFYDEGVVHQFRNPGTEPAVTLEARLNPEE